MDKVLVLNGPNLNLLGSREPDIYGHSTLDDITNALKKRAEDENITLDALQSNYEGAIVEAIQTANAKGYRYIILNAAAFTHYSIAIRDAIAAVKEKVGVIEVHLSNVHAREEFRHHSVIAPVVIGQIAGFGADSYFAALDIIIRRLKAAAQND